MKRISLRGACLLAGMALAAGADRAAAQQQDLPPLTPQRRYNGIVAGEEAYQLNNARRQAEVGRQVDLNADMYWRWSGAGSYYPGVFEAWPIVPGSIWGWPSAVSPPSVSPTRPGAWRTTRPMVAAPSVQQPSVKQQPAGPPPAAQLPDFSPEPARVDPVPAKVPDTSPPPLPGFTPAGERATPKRPSGGPREF